MLDVARITGPVALAEAELTADERVEAPRLLAVLAGQEALPDGATEERGSSRLAEVIVEEFCEGASLATARLRFGGDGCGESSSVSVSVSVSESRARRLSFPLLLDAVPRVPDALRVTLCFFSSLTSSYSSIKAGLTRRIIGAEHHIRNVLRGFGASFGFLFFLVFSSSSVPSDSPPSSPAADITLPCSARVPLIPELVS